MELNIENVSRNKDVTLIDSQTNRALYRITNFQNSMFQSKVNVISRLSRGSREERLAELEKGWFNDHITINAGGVRLKTKKFFDAAVFGGHYTFTGPDGRTRYRWELQNHGLRLTTDDRVRTLIAHYRERRRGLLGIGTKAPARLVVTHSGLDMVDMIVITLAYVERRRQDRNTSTTTSAAA